MSAAPLAPICSICTWQGLVACDHLSSCYLQYFGRAITNTDAQTQIQIQCAVPNCYQQYLHLVALQGILAREISTTELPAELSTDDPEN